MSIYIMVPSLLKPQWVDPFEWDNSVMNLFSQYHAY